MAVKTEREPNFWSRSFTALDTKDNWQSPKVILLDVFRAPELTWSVLWKVTTGNSNSVSNYGLMSHQHIVGHF